MRKLLLILLLLPVFTQAQTVIYTGSTTQTTVQKGGYGADRIFVAPLLDTGTINGLFPTLRDTGRITVWNGIFYYNDGAKWVSTATGDNAAHPAPPDRSIQFNDNDTFAGDARLTFYQMGLTPILKIGDSTGQARLQFDVTTNAHVEVTNPNTVMHIGGDDVIIENYNDDSIAVFKENGEVQLPGYSNPYRSKVLSTDAVGNVGFTSIDTNFIYPDIDITDTSADHTLGIQTAINTSLGLREVSFNAATGAVILDTIGQPTGKTVILPYGVMNLRRGLVKTVNGRPVNSQLYIPFFQMITIDSNCAVQPMLPIKGATEPNYLVGYITNGHEDKLTNGSILRSYINTDGSTYPSILSAVSGDTVTPFGIPLTLNAVQVELENVWFRSRHNTTGDTLGTQLSAMDFYNSPNVTIRNFRCDVDKPSFMTISPTYNNNFGLRMPAVGTGGTMEARTGVITAYRYGTICAEHAILDNVFYYTNWCAIAPATAGYKIECRNVALHSNRYQIRVERANVLDTINTTCWMQGDLRIEVIRTVLPGKWYNSNTANDIIDSFNVLRGRLDIQYNRDGALSNTSLRTVGARQINFVFSSVDTINANGYNLFTSTGIGIRHVLQQAAAGFSIGTNNTVGRGILVVNGSRADYNFGGTNSYGFFGTWGQSATNSIGGINTADVTFLCTDGSASRGLVIGSLTADSVRFLVNGILRMYFTPGGTMFLMPTTLLASPIANAIEHDGTHIYWTDNTNTRRQLDQQAGGTVTSIGLTAGTTGTDVNISGSPVTTSGNITLNIPSASASNRGLVTTGTQTIAGAKTFTSGVTVSQNGTDAVTITGTSTSRIGIVAQNANTQGTTNFYFQNDRGGFAAYGGLGIDGSAKVGTFFGANRADAAFFIGDGANVSRVLAGSITNVPFILGANNLPKMTIQTNVAFNTKISSYNNVAPTNGQILIGHTANGTFEAATLTAGTNMAITNGAGSITLATSATPTFTNITLSGIVEYADNAAALLGGLTNGQLYRTGDILKIVHP